MLREEWGGEEARVQARPTTSAALQMQLRAGDRFGDETGQWKSSARPIARGAERSSTRASRGSTTPPAERCEAGTLPVRAYYPRSKVLVCSASFRKRRIASAVSRKLGRRTGRSTRAQACHAMASTVV